MELTSGAGKGGVKKSVATSDPRKQVMRKEFNQLMKAASENNLKKVKEIIAKHDEDISTIRDLIVAQKNKIEMSGSQLEQSRERISYVTELVNLSDTFYKDGNFPLFIAVQKEYEEIAKYLIDHGADVNKPNNDGVTPLHLAAATGQEAMVKYLVEKGANVNSQSAAEKTALACAITNSAEKGYVSRRDDDHERIYRIVKYLLDKGADPNIGNSMIAAINYTKYLGDTRIMQCLIDHGANVNGEGVLYTAFNGRSPGGTGTEGEFTATKMLLDNGADPTEELTRLRRSLSLMEKLLEDYEPEESKEKRKIELMQEVGDALQKEKKHFWRQSVTYGWDKLVELFIKDGITKEERDNYLSIAQKQLQNSRYNEEVKSQYKKIIEILKESDKQKS